MHGGCALLCGIAGHPYSAAAQGPFAPVDAGQACMARSAFMHLPLMTMLLPSSMSGASGSAGSAVSFTNRVAVSGGGGGAGGGLKEGRRRFV